MKVFVIAMDNEAQSVISWLSNLQEEQMFGRRVVVGDYKNEKVFVVVSGIGKVNAAAATQFAIQATNTKVIYNVGFAGGFSHTILPTEVYQIEEAVQYDFDLSQLNGTKPGTLDEKKNPYIKCDYNYRLLDPRRLGTGDSFTDNPGDAEKMEKWEIELRDMEGAAIAQVCERAGVKCRMFKAATNVWGHGPMHEQYRKNTEKCLEHLTSHVRDILEDSNVVKYEKD